MSRRLVHIILALVALPTVAGASTPGGWSWPLERHSLGERFDPPADSYGPGHRGIDIAASVGDAVRAVAAGQVAFVGKVGGGLPAARRYTRPPLV